MDILDTINQESHHKSSDLSLGCPLRRATISLGCTCEVIKTHGPPSIMQQIFELSHQLGDVHDTFG